MKKRWYILNGLVVVLFLILLVVFGFGGVLLDFCIVLLFTPNKKVRIGTILTIIGLVLTYLISHFPPGNLRDFAIPKAAGIVFGIPAICYGLYVLITVILEFLKKIFGE